jgi:hypothetical protein
MRQYAVHIGEGTVPAHGAERFTATDRLHAFSMSGLLFDTDWTPPRQPWYWRNRFTRWLLRLPPFRLLPPSESPPLVIVLFLNKKIAARFDAAFMSLVRPHMFHIFDPILVLGTDRIDIKVMNASDRDLRVFVQAFGMQQDVRRGVV